MTVSKSDITERIVPGLAEDLRDLPDGSQIRIDELIADSYYADEPYTQEDILFLQNGLFSAAEQRKIRIDLQSDGSFIEHNDAAKYVCPCCGSKNTAHIMYGLPDFSPQLEKKCNSGRLMLGGCLIGRNDRYSNDCRKGFSTFYDISNKQKDEM